MKIAIHDRPGSYSDTWIKYCQEHNISYKIVNCYETDIINQLQDCESLMWHFDQSQWRDTLFAKSILFAVEHAGIRVFPNFRTGWHYDNKVAEKYLLESFNAPMVPSYVFYNKIEALRWAGKTNYPKVFKLKGGAGSSNVRLIKNKHEAKRVINKAFKSGFSQFNRFGYFKERFQRFRSGRDNFIGVLKGIGRLLIPTDSGKKLERERYYVYFQDFIPNNKTDFRIKVVNGKCWGLQRKVRKNDFRASGSGRYIWDTNEIPKEMINIALEITERIGFQSIAYDFVMSNGQALLVEMSYCFGISEKEFTNGYWTQDLSFHKEKFDPRIWMIEDFIKNGQ